MPKAKAKPRAKRPSPVLPEPSETGVVHGRWEIKIDGWSPVSLNELLNVHWAKAGRLKKADRDIVIFHAKSARVPKATGKRRVSMVITVPKGWRRRDEDNLHKSLGDALKHAEMIVNDSPDWISWGEISYIRPGDLSTTIILEDIK